MSDSPFRPDPALAERRSGLVDGLGPLFDERLAAARAAGGVDPVHPAAVIPAAVAADLVRELELRDVEELMLLALETARALARPPVSAYRVGVVGLAPSGDLLLGGNLELPGATIWTTVHGEGSVVLLARARAQTLTTLALSQARPCAHCRQVLAELDGAHGDAVDGGRGEGLRLVDPAGRRLRLADIYPWPFAPGDLGMRGAVAGTRPFPDLALAPAAGATGDEAVPEAVARALVEAGRRSHAPYSGTPAAVVLRLGDGSAFAGSAMENVAFNPSLGPVQEALVTLLAAGREPSEVEAAWLAVPRGAPNGQEAVTRDALAAAAPGARLHVTYWA